MEKTDRIDPSHSFAFDNLIHLSGTLYERIHKGVCDVIEDRPERFFEQTMLEFVMQTKFNLARSFTERMKKPSALKVTKRPVAQAQVHFMRRIFPVFSRKMRLDAMVIDVQRRDRFIL